uniref:Uncharacterized protein n=1 Tax=Globisporangium ultimum (strain ATCC 200006 / CBS 805.95 / DAOM BR144) TaxID=431595 RepID=K3WK61_GLOUD
TIKAKELGELERLGPGGEPNADIAEICVRKGILVQNGSRIEFSSPVMWRFFVKLRVGHIV